MHLIEQFVSNPVKVAVGVLLVALFGTLAMSDMPMQLTPEVQNPTLSIETRWPGASPREVEREIVRKQEAELKSVEGVIRMTSESQDSEGEINLEFAVGTDLAEALLKVNTRLQQVASYPEEVQEPVISTSNLADRSIAIFILTPRPPSEKQLAAFMEQHPQLAKPLIPVQRSANPGLALLRLRRLAEAHAELTELIPEIEATKERRFAEDTIEAAFERLVGVADAEVRGGREQELQVIVDPQRLTARWLTMDQVRTALRGQNIDTSAGDFDEGRRRYVVRTLGQFRNPRQVAETILSTEGGSPVYLRDVAEVRLDYKKPDWIVRRYGAPAIYVRVQRETGANVLQVMEGLRTARDKLNRGALRRRGLLLTQVYDDTEYINASLNLVQQNIFVGGVLTTGALLLFLRSGRSTLIVGLAIPVSIVGTFLILYLMGRSLNVISLAGLAFAVGMLVDNAVVVLENVYRHYQAGERALLAAVRGTQEVWGAVVASTLTTLAVFLPVLFVKEEAGQLFRDIALAISSAVALSLVVSITVVPTAAARILRRQRKLDSSSQRRSRVAAVLSWPLDRTAGAVVGLVVNINTWLLRGTVRRVALFLIVTTGAIGLSYWLMPPVEYLPNGNRNLVRADLLPPPGYNLDELMAMGEQIETAMRPYWDVDPGTPEAEALDYPPIRDFFFFARPRGATFGVRAYDPNRSSELISLLREQVDRFPGTIAKVRQSNLFERGSSGGRTIDLEVRGTPRGDDSELLALGRTVLERVEQAIPGAEAFPQPSLEQANPELSVRLKSEHAAEMGFSARDFGYTVDALVDGAYVTDYFIGGDKIDITLIGQERFANRTQDLQALPIATPTGDMVPLAAVAQVKLGSGPLQINHSGRDRAITIQVTPPEDYPLEQAMQVINDQVIAPLEAGDDLKGIYNIQMEGAANKLTAAWKALRMNLLVAMLITYLLMAALFESFTYPLVIMLSVPLGAVGGFAGLWAVNQFVLQPLDVLTMLGFVILIGTVVNNPILIVHHTLIQIREQGVPSEEAILASARHRIRPILMTTTTTVLGLLPLVIFPGAGSELYRGLGAVVLGGLVMSTLFTLVLVPTVLSLFIDLERGSFGRRCRKWFGEEDVPAA